MIFILAVLCFASFGWGMRRHFRIDGPMSRYTRMTALLGAAGAALDLYLLAPLVIEWRGQASVIVALFAAGLAIFWRAVAETRNKGLYAIGTRGVPPRRITTGLYRWLRHPLYLSYTLVWIACWLASGTWIGCLPAVALGLNYAVEAWREERDLALKLDQADGADQVMKPGLSAKMA